MQQICQCTFHRFILPLLYHERFNYWAASIPSTTSDGELSQPGNVQSRFESPSYPCFLRPVLAKAVVGSPKVVRWGSIRSVYWGSTGIETKRDKWHLDGSCGNLAWFQGVWGALMHYWQPVSCSIYNYCTLFGEGMTWTRRSSTAEADPEGSDGWRLFSNCTT